jgi:hypothetical protein
VIEARLICSNPCEVPDLGLDLKRGEEVWMAYAAAQRSEDLRKEISKGNIRMSRATRRPEQALPRHLPPFVALHRSPGPKPQASRSPEPPTLEPHKVEAPAQIDLDDLARRVRADLLGDVRATVAEEVTRALAAMPPAAAAGVDSAQIASVLESVLRRVLPTGGTAAAAPVRSVATSDEPLYMPTNIVDRDAKGKVVLQTDSSGETGDLDDAATALRELKRQQNRDK